MLAFATTCGAIFVKCLLGDYMPTFDGFLGEVETLEGRRIKIRAMHDISRSKEKISIPTRAGYYPALSIVDFAQTTNKIVNHLWLLGEPSPELIPTGTCEMYCLSGELYGKRFPTSYGLLFMDLQEIAKTGKHKPAREIAQFLLSQTTEIPSNSDIAEFFFNRFRNFKQDREVTKVLALWDKTREEAEAEGIEKGMKRGIAQGLAQGLTQGKAEGKAEIIKSMRASGISIDGIATITTLPVSEVESLLAYEENTG